LSNLYAAHIACNREKSTCSTRAARNRNGLTSAPLSTEANELIRSNNRWGWGTAGALSGAAIAGPPGFVLGGLLGALFGNEIKLE
jgi:hypothetical protein